jgi:hypothetical protein
LIDQPPWPAIALKLKGSSTLRKQNLKRAQNMVQTYPREAAQKMICN